MREIKFRAWDTINKTMMVDGLAVTLNGEFSLLTSRQGDGALEHRLIKDEIFILMQYTGLKDKNGKEIYEGDIVNVRNWGRTDEIVHITDIVWDTDDKGWGFGQFLDVDRYDMFRNIEVIGNIYENPELMKGK